MVSYPARYHLTYLTVFALYDNKVGRTKMSDMRE